MRWFRRRRPRRPKDETQVAVMNRRMATGELPNDKHQVIGEPLGGEELVKAALEWLAESFPDDPIYGRNAKRTP